MDKIDWTDLLYFGMGYFAATSVQIRLPLAVMFVAYQVTQTKPKQNAMNNVFLFFIGFQFPLIVALVRQ